MQHDKGKAIIARLAKEGHGAIQVALPTSEPIKVVLGGPIKHWWSLPEDQWGQGEHAVYIEWRDAVETALVQDGFLVYSPHKALRGAWSDVAQHINDTAIRSFDVFIDLTPPGVSAEGTEAEVRLANANRKLVYPLPPSDLARLNQAIWEIVDAIKKSRKIEKIRGIIWDHETGSNPDKVKDLDLAEKVYDALFE